MGNHRCVVRNRPGWPRRLRPGIRSSTGAPHGARKRALEKKSNELVINGQRRAVRIANLGPQKARAWARAWVSVRARAARGSKGQQGGNNKEGEQANNGKSFSGELPNSSAAPDEQRPPLLELCKSWGMMQRTASQISPFFSPIESDGDVFELSFEQDSIFLPSCVFRPMAWPGHTQKRNSAAFRVDGVWACIMHAIINRFEVRQQQMWDGRRGPGSALARVEWALGPLFREVQGLLIECCCRQWMSGDPDGG